MDSPALSKDLDASPKVLRTVKANKSPVLLKSDYALNTENYSNIGIDEIKRRVKVLDDNPKFIESISLILSDKAKEKMSMDQTEILFEETIYAGGFANEKDKALMKKFHEVDWKVQNHYPKMFIIKLTEVLLKDYCPQIKRSGKQPLVFLVK